MIDQPMQIKEAPMGMDHSSSTEASSRLLKDATPTGQSTANKEMLQHTVITSDGKIDFGHHDDLYCVPVSKPFNSQTVSQAGNIDARYLSGIGSSGGGGGGGGGSDSGGGGGATGGFELAKPKQAAQQSDAANSVAMQWMAFAESGKQQQADENIMRGLGAASGIDQGSKVGDCGFESSLAGVAHTKEGPQLISNMIAQTAAQAKDGSYTVTFPGDPKNPIVVTQSDFNKEGVSNTAEWANVIEAAAIKLKGGGINGINGGDAIHLLTGKHANTDDIFQGIDSSNATRIGQHISEALADGGVVVAGTKGKDTGTESMHYYSVLGYDSKTNKLTLRNPWGQNDGGSRLPGVGKTKAGVKDIGGGVVQMSMSTFMNDFNELDYTGEQPGLRQEAGAVVSNVVHTIVDLPNLIGSL